MSEEPKSTIRKTIHGDYELLNSRTMKWEPLRNHGVIKLLEENPKLAKEHGFELPPSRKQEADELLTTLKRIERAGLDLSKDEVQHFQAKADRLLNEGSRSVGNEIESFLKSSAGKELVANVERMNRLIKGSKSATMWGDYGGKQPLRFSAPFVPKEIIHVLAKGVKGEALSLKEKGLLKDYEAKHRRARRGLVVNI